MREIKFRAWDNEARCFRVATLEHTVGWALAIAPGAELEPWCQYTGLKDKNGVEIYESDIIQVWYGDEADGRPQEVKWDGFCFSPFNDGCGACGSYAMRAFYEFTPNPETPFIKQYTVEVIGNIYENKELLK